MSQYLLAWVRAAMNAAVAMAEVTQTDGARIATGRAAPAPAAVPMALPRIRSRFPVTMYSARMMIGSGTQ